MTNRVLRNVLYLPPLRLFWFITCDKIARYWLKDHRSVVLASRCLLIPLFMILSRNSAIQLRLSLRLLSLYNYSRDNSRVTKDSFKNAYSRVKPYVILMNSNATLVFPFATVVSMFFPRDGCLCSRDAMPAHMPMFLRCLCSFDVYVHAMSMFFLKNYIRVMRLSSSALLWIIFRRELDWWGVLLRNDRRNDKIDWNNRTRL